jgi:pyruvate/2-oxoglutarate dehydrogenase complex dihydrolipoamide acyltransferase (E2) component
VADSNAPNAYDDAVTLAKENDVDLSEITGTGKGGKITVTNVRDFIADRDEDGEDAEEATPAAPSGETAVYEITGSDAIVADIGGALRTLTPRRRLRLPADDPKVAELVKAEKLRKL